MVEDSFYIFPGENFIDLKPYQCGWEKCRSGHSYGPTTRNHFLFHYVVRGKGTLMANGPKGTGNTFHIDGGHGFLIFPGQITTYFADNNMPWEYSWVEFDGLKVKEALSRTTLTPESPIFTPESSKAGDQMLEVMRYITHNKDQSLFNLIGHLYLFMDYLTASSRRDDILRSIKLQDFYMREALNIIEQKYSMDISVEDIAERCGVSRSYLSKIFKENMKSSPKDFLTSSRCQKHRAFCSIQSFPLQTSENPSATATSCIFHVHSKTSAESLPGSGR